MNQIANIHQKTSKSGKLPLISVTGSNSEIGFQLGKQLKKRILTTIDYYNELFQQEEEVILQYAKIFKPAIKSFNNNYAIEIESMAEAIEVDPLWLYALNARSEIMNKFANECTAFYFKKSHLLGQNWDWYSELEDLVILTHIKQSEHEILQLNEPGIIGKIGLNSAGLGVCLNFLHIDGYNATTIPIHVLLRSILDCHSFAEAKKLVSENKIGCAANILVADNQGNFFDLEFAGDESFFLDNSSDHIVHTNHFLSKAINSPTEDQFFSSYNRYDRAVELSNSNPSLDEFKKMLLDRNNKEFPICRHYKKAIKGPDKLSGTVCSLIMDLKKLQMHITRGNPFENPFETISLSQLN